MAITVREIINPELFTLSETMHADDALDALLELEITAAPIVDADRRPIGVVTLRDLLRGDSQPVASSPAVSVAANLDIEEAARLMAESGRHHLVVVGSDGRTMGMISSYDLLRALVGLPPRFPATFPHHDDTLDVTWTDPAPLDASHAAAAPRGPGILVLSTGGRHRCEADLWVESAVALRARVTDLLALPTDDESSLKHVLNQGDIRFRCAAIDDYAQRARAAQRLRERLARTSV